MCAVALGATLLGPAALAAPGDNAGYSGPYCAPFEHADMYYQLFPITFTAAAIEDAKAQTEHRGWNNEQIHQYLVAQLSQKLTEDNYPVNIQYYSYIQSGDRNYAEVEVSHFVTAAQGKGLLQKLLSYPTVQEAQVQPVPHPTVDGPCRFSDVPQNHPFYEEITWLEYRNITTGWADGTYRPLNNIERGAVAAFFYRLAGSPEVTLPAASPFTDVNPSHQFYHEIVWMHQQGLTTGWADGTYRPQDAVTREAMAAFFYRYAGKPDYVVVGSVFKDVPHDGAFYREINWLRSSGITTGWADGTYRPSEPIHRDAMAAFIYRYAHLDT